MHSFQTGEAASAHPDTHEERMELNHSGGVQLRGGFLSHAI